MAQDKRLIDARRFAHAVRLRVTFAFLHSTRTIHRTLFLPMQSLPPGSRSPTLRNVTLTCILPSLKRHTLIYWLSYIPSAASHSLF